LIVTNPDFASKIFATYTVMHQSHWRGEEYDYFVAEFCG